MKTEIKAVQRELGLAPDGIAGPLTWKAISAAVRALKTAEHSATPAADQFHPRKQKLI